MKFPSEPMPTSFYSPKVHLNKALYIRLLGEVGPQALRGLFRRAHAIIIHLFVTTETVYKRYTTILVNEFCGDIDVLWGYYSLRSKMSCALCKFIGLGMSLFVIFLPSSRVLPWKRVVFCYVCPVSATLLIFCMRALCYIKAGISPYIQLWQRHPEIIL